MAFKLYSVPSPRECAPRQAVTNVSSPAAFSQYHKDQTQASLQKFQPTARSCRSCFTMYERPTQRESRAVRLATIDTPGEPGPSFSRVFEDAGIVTKPRLPSAHKLSDALIAVRGEEGRSGRGLLHSTSQREDQVERCASGEAVVVGGLVVGPAVVVQTLVSPLVLSLHDSYLASPKLIVRRP